MAIIIMKHLEFYDNIVEIQAKQEKMTEKMLK